MCVLFKLQVLLFVSTPTTAAGLPNLQLLQTKAATIGNLTTLYGFQALYPNLTFTCDCTIMAWSLVGTLQSIEPQLDGTRAQYPELQIWRETNTPLSPSSNASTRSSTNRPTRYGRQTFTLAIPDNEPSNPNNTRLLLSVRDGSTQVRTGDILGIYQPPMEVSRVVLWHQFGTGSVSYHSNQTSERINIDETSIVADYPLVSIEAEPGKEATISVQLLLHIIHD